VQTVDIKGKKWTIDIGWEILAGELPTIQEAKESARRHSYNHGVIVDYENATGIGLIKKSPPKAPSAALYLALANRISMV